MRTRVRAGRPILFASRNARSVLLSLHNEADARPGLLARPTSGEAVTDDQKANAVFEAMSFNCETCHDPIDHPHETHVIHLLSGRPTCKSCALSLRHESLKDFWKNRVIVPRK